MTKKNICTITLAIFFFLAFNQKIFAQCDSFGFPSYQNNSILFFSCDSGEIQKFDAQNQLSSIPRKESLGGFVHNFVWSPDGTEALVLAENVLVTTQTLAFYSPERKMNSLNWWVYDLDTEKATLLNEKIISIGWTARDEVVYNWNNESISLAKIDDPSFSKFTKLTDIKKDSDDLNYTVSPANLNDAVVFPMKNGFYAINSGKKEVKYYALTGGTEKIISDPFGQKYFLIKTGDSLYKFSIPDNNLSTIDISFSPTDFAFLDKDLLAIIGNDGKVYSYDINLKSKNSISLNVNGPISNVFTTGKQGEFIFATGKNIFLKSTKSDTLVPLKQAPENTGQQNTTAQPAQSSNGKNNLIIIISVVVALIAIMTVFLYLRARKENLKK